MARDGRTHNAPRHVPYLKSEAYLTIFWENLHFKREKNSVPYLKKKSFLRPWLYNLNEGVIFPYLNYISNKCGFYALKVKMGDFNMQL